MAGAVIPETERTRGEVVIIRTGTANVASVIAAFERLGFASRLTTDAALVREAAVVVLPGVGAFGAGMAALREARLDDAVMERVRAGRALLAICLGLQLLCEASEESPGVAGLGVVRGRVERLREEAGVRVPQLGWNEVRVANECSLVTRGSAYFANSFALREKPPGWGVAVFTHGGEHIAALERGNVLACQCHPELSGAWGAGLMRRWAERASAEVKRC